MWPLNIIYELLWFRDVVKLVQFFLRARMWFYLFNCWSIGCQNWVELLKSDLKSHAGSREKIRLTEVDHANGDRKVFSLIFIALFQAVHYDWRRECGPLVLKQHDSLLHHEDQSEKKYAKTNARANRRPVCLIALFVVEEHWRTESVPLQENLRLETAFASSLFPRL